MKKCFKCNKEFLDDVLKMRAGRYYCPLCIEKDNALYSQLRLIEEPEDYESDTGNSGLELKG